MFGALTLDIDNAFKNLAGRDGHTCCIPGPFTFLSSRGHVRSNPARVVAPKAEVCIGIMGRG